MRPAHRYPIRVLWLAVLTAGLCSCINEHRVRMAETDPDGWSPADPAQVAYENTDTLSRRDLYAVVRLCNDFNYDKLALSVTTVTPDGYRWCDTLYIDAYGRLPKVGLYGELEQPYRRGVVLAQPGRYLFSFAPVMPAVPTQAVAAVGIRLDESPRTDSPENPADTSRTTP